MRRLAVLVTLIAYSWLCGCTAPYSYRLKLTGNPERTDAEACWARCKRSKLYPRCLAACPGVKVAKGSCSAVRKAADCSYWSALLASQSDETTREHTRRRMPEECRGTPSATAPAPALLCGEESRLNSGESLVATPIIVAGLAALGLLVLMVVHED